MKCNIEIRMDNAVFQDSPELARILGELSDRLYEGTPNYCDWDVRDINGNKVGTILIEKERK